MNDKTINVLCYLFSNDIDFVEEQRTRFLADDEDSKLINLKSIGFDYERGEEIYSATIKPIRVTHCSACGKEGHNKNSKKCFFLL